jgi:hypothetical protein
MRAPRMDRLSWIVFHAALALGAAAAVAVAQPALQSSGDDDDSDEPATVEPGADQAEAGAVQDEAGADQSAAVAGDLAEAVRRLQVEVAELREQNELLRDDAGFRDQRLEALSQAGERVSGYIDVGFFVVQGDGSGIRPDFGNRNFPEYEGVVPGSWVFMGDPLSTAINARGEPADTGDSRALQSDPVNAGNRPTFILNTASVSFFRGLGARFAVETTLDFAPRARDLSDPEGVPLSQYFELPRAYVQYIAPLESFDLHVYVGKFDSVLGYEYRDQEAPRRITVTPSLICRYTCGHPLGVKARAFFLDRALVVGAAITNGSHFSERFPFRDEIDANALKTAAARLSYSFAVGAGLEIGLSGALGAQDGQPENDVIHWHAGADLSLDWRNLVMVAEYVQGNAPGRTEAAPCNVTPCLDYRGAYGLIAYRVGGGLIPYGRVDWRDALHHKGADFVYVSDLLRVTGGVRKELGSHLAAKLEYTLNRELGRIPQARNDIFTSSVVVQF